jgi:hypothetical protein
LLNVGFWQTRAPDGCSSHEKEDFPTMRRIAAVLAIVTCAVTLLSSCGDDDPSEDPGGTTTETKTIEITFSGDSVEPNGERVEVKAGQEIELVVKADEPGELHVHSNPEQELEYGAGTTTLKLTLDEPGVVDVESHHLEKVIVQLEVS